MTQTIPTRDELILRIEDRYRCDLEKARIARDAAIHAISNVDASTIEILASLLSGEPTKRSDANLATREPVAAHRQIDFSTEDSEGEEESDESSDSSSAGYGEITERIKKIATAMPGEFSVRDIVANSEVPPNHSTISGVLRKLEKAGILELVELGAGKRPSRFRVALRPAGIEATANHARNGRGDND